MYPIMVLLLKVNIISWLSISVIFSKSTKSDQSFLKRSPTDSNEPKSPIDWHSYADLSDIETAPIVEKFLIYSPSTDLPSLTTYAETTSSPIEQKPAQKRYTPRKDPADYSQNARAIKARKYFEKLRSDPEKHMRRLRQLKDYNNTHAKNKKSKGIDERIRVHTKLIRLENEGKLNEDQRKQLENIRKCGANRNKKYKHNKKIERMKNKNKQIK